MTASVIIPLFNKAPFIRRALDSVVTQTLGDFEVVAVDDGSEDGGSDIVARYPDSRIRVIRQQNAGPGAARNVGIRHASSDLVAFLDADDEWLPDYLAQACAALKANPDVALVTMSYVYAGQPAKPINDWLDTNGVMSGKYNVGSSQASDRFLFALLGHMGPQLTVVRKSVLLRYGGFFDKWKCLYAEDQYLWIQVLLNESIMVVREPLTIIHTEASELCRNLKGPRPIQPFLVDPTELYSRCPARSQYVLRRILALFAVAAAGEYSRHRQYHTARKLLVRYCWRYRPAMFWHTVAYATIPTFVPVLRSTMRRVRSVMNPVP